jgi:hypothetical protein
MAAPRGSTNNAKADVSSLLGSVIADSPGKLIWISSCDFRPAMFSEMNIDSSEWSGGGAFLFRNNYEMQSP